MSRDIVARRDHLIMQLHRSHPVGIRDLCRDEEWLSRRRLTGRGGNLPDLRRGVRGEDGIAAAGRRAGRFRGPGRHEQHGVDRQVAAAQGRVDHVDRDDVVAHLKEGTGGGQVDQFPLALVVGDAAGGVVPHLAAGDVPPRHLLPVDPDDAAVVHVQLHAQCRHSAGIRHAELVAKINGGVVVPHVIELRLVVVVAVADAGAAGFPVTIFAETKGAPGIAPGRRRGAFFVPPLVVVVVDEDRLLPGCFALSLSSGREPPASAEVVVEGGMDQLDRAAVLAAHRPRELVAVLHRIGYGTLPVSQHEPLPVVGQAPAVAAKRPDGEHRLQPRGILGHDHVPARLQHSSLREGELDPFRKAPAREIHRHCPAVVNLDELLRGGLVGRLVMNLVDHHRAVGQGGNG